MSKTYRVREDESEALEAAAIKFIIETKRNIRASDVLHALVKKHLKDLKASDVIAYLERNG